MHGLSLVDERTAVLPLILKDGERVVGIDGNRVHVSDGASERAIETPFFDGGRAHVELHTVGAEDGLGDVSFWQMVPDPEGNRMLKLHVERSKGLDYLVVRLLTREEAAATAGEGGV